MKIHILESHHFSKIGYIDWTKIFLKGKFFLQNDILKTRKLYEYILVDTDSVEIWYIQNKDSTKICYSKCKIFKIISKIEWEQSLSTHKMFSQNFKPSNLHLMIIMIIWMHGFVFSFFDPLIIPGSPTKMIRFKLCFQLSFKNDGCSLAPSLKSFILKSNLFMLILKSMLRVWSLLFFLKLFYLLFIFNSHGFCVGTLSKRM